MKRFRDSKGKFIKGHKINIGRKFTEETKQKMRKSNNKSWFKKGSDMSKTREYVKGIPRSEEVKRKISNKLRGKSATRGSFKKGHIHSEETLKKMSNSHKGKHSGSNCNFWKGGISKDIIRKKKYAKIYGQKRKAMMKGGGKLSIHTIQLIYEDNIKKYGTLTCYLCLNPIKFSEDSLEHKIPLIRGGTNEYNNLAVACIKCNHRKNKKTEEEFRNGEKTSMVSGKTS